MTKPKEEKSSKSAQLILWRHAHAEEGTVDSARQLTARGRKQASRIAHWLEGRLPDHYRLIVSPAARAQQTAQALTGKFQTNPELSVDSNAQQILKAINWAELTGTTILVGHQPTLGCLAAFLITGREHPWNIRKGALWWLHRQEAVVSIRMVVDPSLI
jgi:phosphohistidine phosphatase